MPNMKFVEMLWWSGFYGSPRRSATI